MATKNLARTVVEGGRATYSTLERIGRNRRERRLRFDTDGNEATGRSRCVGSRGFDDRLAVLHRWLHHNLGRGWGNVYHEFCERVDRRTMKGWHLNEHLFMIVDTGRWPGHGAFLVDACGILRQRMPRSWGRGAAISATDEARARMWAAGRQVIVHGDAIFWTARTVDRDGPTSPQGQRFTPRELEEWLSLPQALRHMLTYAPGANRTGGGEANTYRVLCR